MVIVFSDGLTSLSIMLNRKSICVNIDYLLQVNISVTVPMASY